jgi:hypothetical protein
MRFQINVRRFPEDRVVHYLVDINRVILNLEGDRIDSIERRAVLGHRIMGCVEHSERKLEPIEYSPKLEEGKLLVLKNSEGDIYITTDRYNGFESIN